MFCISSYLIVEAYTASWIEISWERGTNENTNVEAYTASWIEIRINVNNEIIDIVEAYTASWIEICMRLSRHRAMSSRSLYGFVD